MSHPIYRIVSFNTVGAYTLRIAFDDGTERTVNFLPVLSGELYAPLRDLALFNAVKIDPEVHTLCVAQRRRLRSRDVARLARIRGRPDGARQALEPYSCVRGSLRRAYDHESGVPASGKAL